MRADRIKRIHDEHGQRITDVGFRALMSGDYPRPRHLLVGLTVPYEDTVRAYLAGCQDRTIVYLAVLFLARCWLADEPYADALLTALGVWLAFLAVQVMLRGWLAELGIGPCPCRSTRDQDGQA